MIELLFEFIGEYVLVRIEGNTLLFGSTANGAMLATIDGLRLSKSGVMKEFPDLWNNPEWKSIAIKRLREKIAGFNTEKEVSDYVIQDLKKYGYNPKTRMIAGFRKEALK